MMSVECQLASAAAFAIVAAVEEALELGQAADLAVAAGRNAGRRRPVYDGLHASFDVATTAVVDGGPVTPSGSRKP